MNLINAYHSYGLVELTQPVWCFIFQAWVDYVCCKFEVELFGESDLDVGACYLIRKCAMKTFNMSLNTHGISNNMLLKLPAQR